MLTNVALVAAGGLGTRAADITRHSPKAFINYKGKPLVFYVALSLKLADVKQLIISINDIKYERVLETICSELDINAKVRLVECKGATYVPYQCRNCLPERFFYLFGNSPSNPSHLVGLDRLVGNSELGVSLFAECSSARPRKVRVENSKVMAINFGEKANGDSELYLNTPLLLTKHYVDLLPQSNFYLESTLKSFLKCDNVIRGKVADFTPEFNYSYELPRMYNFIDKLVLLGKEKGIDL